MSGLVLEQSKTSVPVYCFKYPLTKPVTSSSLGVALCLAVKSCDGNQMIPASLPFWLSMSNHLPVLRSRIEDNKMVHQQDPLLGAPLLFCAVNWALHRVTFPSSLTPCSLLYLGSRDTPFQDHVTLFQRSL